MTEKEKFYRALKWCIYLFMFLVTFVPILLFIIFFIGNN